MDGVKCVFPSLDIEAHGVNDSPGSGHSAGDQAWSDRTAEPSSEAGRRARSGCRVAIRTAKPLSCRWRAMRRPRNPVPPNTVTTCPGTGRTYAVAGPDALRISVGVLGSPDRGRAQARCHDPGIYQEDPFGDWRSLDPNLAQPAVTLRYIKPDSDGVGAGAASSQPDGSVDGISLG
jgi:hypothetical protein